MLSAAERREFEERGVVRLPGAVAAGGVAALRERVAAFLARKSIVPENPEPGFFVRSSLLAPLMRRRPFAPFWGERVLGAVDEILGAGAWQAPDAAGQILFVTLPEPASQWELPHRMWHLDYAAPGALRSLPGLQLFVCLDRIEPRGGATLVAAGVPALVDAIRRRKGESWPGRSAEVRRALRAHVAWFDALSSYRPGEDRVARFMERPTHEGGAELQVLELTGEPGDVHLMHPWMLHDLSRNCGSRPRLALTARLHAR